MGAKQHQNFHNLEPLNSIKRENQKEQNLKLHQKWGGTER